MTATYNAPFWSKPLKRWIVQTKDKAKTLQFFSEEAALKWLSDPEAHTDLPIKQKGHVARRAGPVMMKHYKDAYE